MIRGEAMVSSPEPRFQHHSLTRISPRLSRSYGPARGRQCSGLSHLRHRLPRRHVRGRTQRSP